MKSVTTYLDRARWRLAIISLAALIGIAVLLFFFAKDLSANQITLLSMVITAIVAKSGSAFSWFFDGTPDKLPHDPLPPDPPPAAPVPTGGSTP